MKNSIVTSLHLLKEEVIIVDSWDLGRYIAQEYNLDEYNIAYNEEYGQASALIMIVKNKSISSLPEPYSIINSSTDLDSILDDLCFNGKIPEGKYIIDVNY